MKAFPPAIVISDAIPIIKDEYALRTVFALKNESFSRREDPERCRISMPVFSVNSDPSITASLSISLICVV